MPFSLFILTKPPFKFHVQWKGSFQQPVGPLVLMKTRFSSLFWNKLMIPHANCNGHVPFDLFHHIRLKNDTLGFFGNKYLSEQYWQMRHIRLCRPRWLSWMRRPTGDQEVAGSTPVEVGNILSWRLIMKYFLRSFSPFRWFKKGSCQFLAKECAQYWLTA